MAREQVTVDSSLQRVTRPSIPPFGNLVAANEHGYSDLLDSPLMIITNNRPLTPREMDVFQLLGQGKTSKEISVLLQLSTGTVSNHRKSLRRKLGVHSTAELIRCAALYSSLTQVSASLPKPTYRAF
jgi:DNA-binding CsgD family transcriptional regulator